MKIFVILLAFGLSELSVSEKLSRGYLPPPGAKYAGGESEDLQIPLQHPKEISIFRSGFDVADKEPEFINEPPNKTPTHKSVFEMNAYKPEYKNGFTRTNYNDGTPGVEELLPTITGKNPYGYTESYAVGGSATTIPPLGLEIDTSVKNIDGSLNYRYPMNENQFISEQGQYEKPESGITTSDDIIHTYQPKAFGMYGGIPMIVRTFTELSKDSQPANYLRSNNLNTNDPLSDLSILNENFGPVSRKPEFTGTSLIPSEIIPESSINAIIPSPQIVQSPIHKIPERPRGEIDRNAVILRYKNIQTPEGYAYNFETSNGIKMDESATTMDSLKAQGSYSYIGDDGKVYNLSYVADENGFQPRGDHLPTPPPIPETIKRVIEQALRNKEAGIIHDGSYDDKKYGHMKYEKPVSRYSQNIKINTEVNNRNEDTDGKKPVSNGQTKTNISFERRFKPVKTLKGHLEMKPVQNNHRGDNYDSSPKTNYSHRPISSNQNKETIVQLIKKPVKTSFYTQLPIEKNDKEVSILKSGLGHKNIQQNTNTKDINSFMQNENSAKVVQPDNAGYYYVPPSSLFIEGRLQGKQKNPIDKHSKVKNNYINVNAVPRTNINDITDQFSTKPVEKAGEYFTIDEPLFHQQTSEIDFPKDNINSDRLITDKPHLFSNVLMQNIKTVPVANINGDNVVTDYSIRDNTKIDIPKEILKPENRNEIATPSIRNDISIKIYQSTTPLPPQTNTVQILRSNQYETTPVESANTPYEEQAHEGYPRVTPDVPATFEEVTSPTFKPIYIEDDDTANIQVDGFGRPIEEVPVKYQNELEKYNQDTDLSKNYNNQLKTNEYFTTGLPNNKESKKDVIHPTDKTTNYYGNLNTSTSVNSETPGLGFAENSDPKETTLRYSDDETMLPGVIGEDFSGPKQPQKYDTETGYYY